MQKKNLHKVRKKKVHQFQYKHKQYIIVIILDEDFKEAKIYKELGDRLTGLWRFLINLENDKQEAVVNKNYDEADKIKVEACVRCEKRVHY
jgi:hypothetical protein